MMWDVITVFPIALGKLYVWNRTGSAWIAARCLGCGLCFSDCPTEVFSAAAVAGNSPYQDEVEAAVAG